MKKLLLLLLMLPCALCNAQTKPAGELHFNNLTVKDGLPEGSAQALLQDKEGYIWMGTQNGLVKYDGYKPKTYILGADIPYKKGITRLYEDKSGTLWAGTFFQGLFYYDRAKDKFMPIVSAVKSDSLSSMGIYNIQEDALGNLCVEGVLLKHGTILEKSNASFIVLFLNIKTKKYRRFDVSKTPGPLRPFAEDKNGGIWFGSPNGIYTYDYKQHKFTGYYTAAASSKKQYFGNAVQSPLQPDYIWLSFGNNLSNKPLGLCRFNAVDKSLVMYKHDAKDSNSILGNHILFIKADDAHRLWFATENGLSLYNPVKNNFSNYILNDEYKNAGGDSIYNFKEDKNGNFWCCTNSGLLYFNTKTKSFSRYTANENQEDGLAGNNIDNTLIDDNGILWLEANQSGLQWINKSRSKYILYKNNPGPHLFPGGAVNDFAEAPDGSFWMAADHGLFHSQPQTDSFTQIKLDKTQNNDIPIGSVAVDKDGWVWCGVPENKSTVKGLYSYNPANGAVKNYRNHVADTNSLPDNNIYHLLSDHTGLLWIGTANKGVCYFNKQSQKLIRFGFKLNENNTKRNSDKLDDGYVQSLYEDSTGNIWIGTNFGGLNKYNRQTRTFISFQNPDAGLSCPLSIYEDSKGSLWAGTFDGGLIQFGENLQSFKRFARNSVAITGIQEDNYHNLWIHSLNGIVILNPGNNRLRYMQEIGNSTNGTYGGTPMFKTRNGLFLIGVKDGFVSLNPDDFLPDTTVPVMHIEAVSFMLPQKNTTHEKDSSVIRYGKNKIHLAYNENRVTFSYVGLLYQNTSSIQYAYQLDGYDKDWVEAGTQRIATYTNLSPGTYTFHVKAANSDGVWTTKEDSITIIISPPWWRTWWAYLLYAIIFIVALSSFIAYRSAALKRENKVLEDKVNLRTSQLQASITDLKSTQSQLIQSEKMASLGELTAGIAHEIQNPLNFVNNFSDVNKELLGEMKDEIDKGNTEEAKVIANDIIANEEKINHHGKRAGDIVKGMLQHSRSSTGVKEPTDINALADEYLRLSYHGLRAKDKNFNAEMKTEFDSSIGKINIIPQDIGRVLLNLYNNAFYACTERSRSIVNQQKTRNLISYEPTVTVKTFLNPPLEGREAVIITVSDNGNGIPEKVKDKIFQPFFTTKPTGQGTGLGLSLSYDIIKAHGGEIKVASKEGEGTEFIITIPA